MISYIYYDDDDEILNKKKIYIYTYQVNVGKYIIH